MVIRRGKRTFCEVWSSLMLSCLGLVVFVSLCWVIGLLFCTCGFFIFLLFPLLIFLHFGCEPRPFLPYNFIVRRV